VFIVPLSVLAATYCSICREIWLHAGRSPQGQQGNCNPLISRAKMNTVKQMVAVLALYVVCSAPFISAQLWATWDEHAHSRPFFTGIPFFSVIKGLQSNPVVFNPFLFIILYICILSHIVTSLSLSFSVFVRLVNV
jgi:arginine vasopressin receptor 1A